MNDRVGQQLGNYRLLRLLGEGGQASVYLGEHVYLKSQAAIKVRHSALIGDEQAVFLREAQTLVQLAHPHIVRVLDFALQDGLPFLVMEYAAHGTLRQRHPRGTWLPIEVIVPYVKQVASALQYTHDQGLIHRDVKPENMLLNTHDQVLLSDFGLVMIAPHLLSSEATEPMEQSLAGTTSYLAPEEVCGKAQPASDQYALAVVVYEWLCGQPPFQGPFLEVAVKLVSAPVPSLREQLPDLSPDIEEVVLRALAKEPEQRFQTVLDFATALERAYQGEVSPRLTPVLTRERGEETTKKKFAARNLPVGTVTMLFTDMEGSTRLLQQLGERYAGVLAECRQLMRAAFQHWNGHEVDTQGDAFFVVFTRAIDAVSAAVEAQRADGIAYRGANFDC
jgi:eukaryotic-like serine/threonine-protein kinase